MCQVCPYFSRISKSVCLVWLVLAFQSVCVAQYTITSFTISPSQVVTNSNQTFTENATITRAPGWINNAAFVHVRGGVDIFIPANQYSGQATASPTIVTQDTTETFTAYITDGSGNWITSATTQITYLANIPTLSLANTVIVSGQSVNGQATLVAPLPSSVYALDFRSSTELLTGGPWDSSPGAQTISGTLLGSLIAIPGSDTVTPVLNVGGYYFIPGPPVGVTVVPQSEPYLPCQQCEAVAGSPINLTNGNVWIQHQDYSIPGLGGGFSLSRTWNSLWMTNDSSLPAAGMFGNSWRSTYEERLFVLNSTNIKYVRANGDGWYFTWNNAANAYYVVHPVNQHAALTFDSSTGLYTLTFADGTKEIFNSPGYLSARVDRNGNRTTVAYDSSQRITQVTDPASRTLTFSYSDPNNPNQATSVADATGSIATYNYTGTAQLSKATYADSSSNTYNYDPSGAHLITSVTDGQGKVLESHTYDSNRHGLTSSRANGVDSVTVSFPSNSQVQLTDSLNNATTYGIGVASALKFVTSVSGPACSSCGAQTSLSETFDSSGNVSSKTDALSNATNYTYDSNGNVLSKSTRLADGTTPTWNYTYNLFGEVLTVSDPLNHVTTNTYDGNGNLLTTTTPSPDGTVAGSTTIFTYNPNGTIATITDPNSNITTIAYTTAGLISSVTDANNKVTSYTYDARGNRLTVSDPVNGTGNPTLFTYDSMNRLLTTIYPGATRAITFGYDYRGRRISVTDQNGNTTQYAYDDADRLTSVTDAQTPNAGTTQYGYDTENNITSITDANSHQTTFHYNTQRQVDRTTFPSGLVESYGYDAANNLTSKTDRNSHTINYSYDALERVTSRSYPDSLSVGYTYDLAGRLTQVQDATGTYSFSYDNMDRLKTASTQYTFLAGQTFTLQYGYDAASNRTSMIDPQQTQTTYGYDVLNRLTNLGSTSGSFGFGYDALGRRTQLTRQNGINTNYSYDPMSRLQSVLHQAGNTTLDGASYTYDGAGNRTSKTNYLSGDVQNYSYDNIYQLLQVTQGNQTIESYTYDLVGNRLSSTDIPTYNYNSSNELTSTSSTNYGYDANGNLGMKTDSTGLTQYTWDFENRLSSVTLPGSGGTVLFRYDPFGRRIQKSGLNGTTNYLYDGANVLEEIDFGGSVLARYGQTGNVDEPLSQLRGTNTSYYEADGLGTVTSSSNPAGAVAQTYTFDSFGNQTASSGSLISPFRYTAREFDAETNLNYYRARYYDPQIGRFLSSDPSGFWGGLNTYAYVGNDPISLIDPTGLDWIEYTGQTLTIWPGAFKGRGNPPIAQCKATSGYPGYQNPGFANQVLGPVPQGHYRINLGLDPKRWASIVPSGENLAAGYGVQRIRPSYVGPNGETLVPEGWGTWRARLQPLNVSTTRSNFYLHNSTKGFTHGCVETCDSLYNRFVTYHDQGLAGIDVLVDYTTNSTNGGTLVP